ncbi:MAG TPA: DUF1841 family protein [Candidatus Tenderia sp.]|nr:DUF1841 family protein [Candidatus Tenderia sp.]
MFTQDRRQMRQFFVDVWAKAKQKEALEPMEQMLANIMEMHPEYHPLLSKGEQSLEQDFTPEMGQSNPFLHMAMHIAIHEQVSTDRPAGIRDIYQKIGLKQKDPHEVEHAMMECLGEMMWQAQRSGGMPDEQGYLSNLKKLI